MLAMLSVRGNLLPEIVRTQIKSLKKHNITAIATVIILYTQEIIEIEQNRIYAAVLRGSSLRGAFLAAAG